jgi:CHAD domain-containing protein
MGKKVKLKIHEKEEFEQGVIRLFLSLHEESARLVLLKSHQHKSVHELRKNIKKIRGILRLVRHEIGQKKYEEMNTYYREMAAEVAVLRDDTSQIELLEGMMESVKSNQVRKSISKAIRQVQAKRKKEFHNFYAQKKQLKVNRSFKEKMAEYKGLIVLGNPEKFILKSLRKTYRGARQALKMARKSNDKEVYHDLRKQVKYLMYHLMTLSSALDEDMIAYTQKLNKLADYLGNLHDLDLFNGHIKEEKLIKLEPEKKKLMMKYIYRRRSYLRKKVHHSGNELFLSNSKNFSNKLFEVWTKQSVKNEVTA